MTVGGVAELCKGLAFFSPVQDKIGTVNISPR